MVSDSQKSLIVIVMRLIVYLINLDGSDQRLRSASTQLRELGIEYERVPAVDGRGKSPKDFKEVDFARTWQYLGRPLSGGEVGCYLSHVECANRFLASNADVCLVMEDDIAFHLSSFMEVLKQGIQMLPEGWDVINFGNQKNKIYSNIQHFQLDGATVHLVKAHYFPMTTTGLCWSRSGAEAFIREAFPIFASVDRFLRHWQTRRARGYCFMPPLVSTTGAASDISRPSKTAQLSVYRKWMYGIKKQSRMVFDKLIAYQNKILY